MRKTKYFGNLVKEIESREGKELELFLRSLLTEKEIVEIPKRLEIIKLLKEGVTQREIAERLHVAIATVIRGSRVLKKGQFKNVE